MNTPDNDVWVFSYASLMWRPDFNHLEAQPVRLFLAITGHSVSTPIFTAAPGKIWDW